MNKKDIKKDNEWESFKDIHTDMNLGFWEIQAPGIFNGNQRFWTTLGYKSDDAIPNPDIRLNHLYKDDFNRIADLTTSCLNGDLDFYDETFRVKTRDGNIKWIRERCLVTEKENDGKSRKIVGIFWDITDDEKELKRALSDIEAYKRILKKQNEKSLQMVEKEKGKVEDRVAERDRLIAIYNKAVSILFANKGNPEKLMWRMLNILGKSMGFDSIHIYRNQEINGDLFFSQFGVWQKGKIFHREHLPALINVPYHEITRVLGLRIDEFSSEPVEISVSDYEKEFLYDVVNANYSNILMLPLIINEQFWGFVSFEYDDRHPSFSPTDINILDSSVYLIGLSIRKQGVLTSLIKTKQKAIDSASAKTNFLSKMSHEIRTPMNAIVGMTELSKESDSMNQIKKNLNKIDGASKQLISLVNEILDLSKIEAGRMEISLEQFYFPRMLEHVVNVVQVNIGEKKQTLHLDYEKPSNRMMISDELRLSQVLINLINNASKFTPENGDIWLTIEELPIDPNNSELKVTVKDSGIGISEEQQDKLFDSYQQAEADTSKKFGGSGLGLMISKKIINMLGGDIYIESELNKGASFIFNIKVGWGDSLDNKQLESKSEDSKDQRNFGNYWRGQKVLIVEDIDINREILEGMLEGTGLEIDIAVNGEEAVKKYKKSNTFWDLILMDIEMPEMNGVDAVIKIRESEEKSKQQRTPVVAMTANAFREDEMKYIQAGMDGHLSKPIDSKKLKAEISKYLENQKDT